MTSSATHNPNDRADIDALKCDPYLLMAELAASGAKPDLKKMFPCPFHNEKTSSCHLKQEGSTWFFKCFGCGKGGDVITAYALRMRIDNRQACSELLKQHRGNPNRAKVAQQKYEQEVKPPKIYSTLEDVENTIVRGIRFRQSEKGNEVSEIKIEAKYEYVDPETSRLDLVVYRVHYWLKSDPTKRHKQFAQIHPVGDGWVMRKKPGKQPLYNRRSLKNHGWAIYCEGEKACHALMKLGFPATTNPGGSNVPPDDIDFTPLENKRVYLWPDNDPINEKTGVSNGIEHMKRCSEKMLAMDEMPDVYWIDPDVISMGPKQDAYDFCELNKDEPLDSQRKAVYAVMESARVVGSAAIIDEYLEKVFTGQMRPIQMPWPMLHEMTRALIPGTVTILCGAAGATKSIMGLQLMIHILFREKKRVAILMLEDSFEYHLMRGLAIWCQIGPLTKAEWCEQHRDVVMTHRDKNYRFINEFGRTMECRSDQTISPDSVLEFIERWAKAGARVIYIDPVTMIEAGENQWVTDLSFMIKAKAIAKQYGVALIFVTHPKTGSNQKKGMDFMAGGQSYVRFSHTILWLEALPEPEHGEFKQVDGKTYFEHYNRVVWDIKSRNSYGMGKAVGFNFNGSTFELEELGQLVPEKIEEKK